MTILFIVECLDKGVGKHVLDLYQNFKEDNSLKIKVAIGKERSDINMINQIDKDDRIIVKSLKRNIGLNDIKSVFELKKIIKTINPDIVHCHSSKAGLNGRIAAKICGVRKIIYSPHAYFFLNYNDTSFKFKMFLFIEKLMAKLFTDYTVTTSDGEDKVFEKNRIDILKKKKFIEHGIVEPIYNISKRKEIRENLGVKDNEILIGAMARFEKQKNPIGTFEILKKCNEIDKCKTVFWGNGSMYNEVCRLNKSEVLLPGNVNNPDDYLGALDIYLTASYYEGLPYTLIEAIGLGLPIIASNVVGNDSCVINNGFLFDVNEPSIAVELIKKMIEDNKFKEYSKNSKKIFLERFNLNVMVNKYRSLYNNE